MKSHPSSARTIRDQLLLSMKEGEYADCARLPRESILADKLGISRTQLRDILASLEREGFITRRHGVGTIINHHVLDIQTRMDIEVEFLDMIRQSGHKADVAYVRTADGTADEATAQKLQIPVGSPVLLVSRLCTADGQPAIYCEDILPKALIQKEYTARDLRLPIFHFLQNFCGTTSYLDLTNLHPAVTDARLAEIFHLPIGAPLLWMDEVDYDIEGTPVFCSNEYFADGFFCHTVVRKKL